MRWAQRLKRVFKIDIETCSACGGAMRIIACIEDAVVIEKILAHLDRKNPRRRGAGCRQAGRPRRSVEANPHPLARSAVLPSQ